MQAQTFPQCWHKTGAVSEGLRTFFFAGFGLLIESGTDCDGYGSKDGLAKDPDIAFSLLMETLLEVRTGC